MPWLIKEELGVHADGKGRNGLLYVHVPRCGGTSMSHHYAVDQQSWQGKGVLAQAMLRFFFYRYQLYETANFPWRTWETLWAVASLLTGVSIYVVLPGHEPCVTHRPRVCGQIARCSKP